jgi:hypothetical protein
MVGAGIADLGVLRQLASQGIGGDPSITDTRRFATRADGQTRTQYEDTQYGRRKADRRELVSGFQGHGSPLYLVVCTAIPYRPFRTIVAPGRVCVKGRRRIPVMLTPLNLGGPWQNLPATLPLSVERCCRDSLLWGRKSSIGTDQPTTAVPAEGAHGDCTSLCTSNCDKHGTYGTHGKRRADRVNPPVSVSYSIGNE